MLVDAHLDLAYNSILIGRDLALPAIGTQAVAFPELRAAGVTLVCGTLHADPAVAESAERQALAQLDLYKRWEDAGEIRIVRTTQDLDCDDGRLGLIVLMEGADPIAHPSELPLWFDRGVRMVGPAWGRTRYAGGTGEPGELTEIGLELVTAMRGLGVILDLSHLDEPAFWQALDLCGTVCATHVHPRGFLDPLGEIPLNRHLTDEMFAAIVERDGMVGITLFNGFLEARPGTRVTLDNQVRTHAEYVARLVSWDRIGIGSDLDGGFDNTATPIEIRTAADLPRLAEIVPAEARHGFLGGNWLAFFRQALR